MNVTADTHALQERADLQLRYWQGDPQRHYANLASIAQPTGNRAAEWYQGEIVFLNWLIGLVETELTRLGIDESAAPNG